MKNAKIVRINFFRTLEIIQRLKATEKKRLSSFLINFNWRIIALQYCDGFAIHPNESAIGVHVSPSPEPPSHLPPHPITLGCPREQVLCALLLVSNSHWPSICHMVIYMFQCYSLKSSHPCLLPLSSKVCSFICISFAALHAGTSAPSF